jgi:hypothetical protein
MRRRRGIDAKKFNRQDAKSAKKDKLLKRKCGSFDGNALVFLGALGVLAVQAFCLNRLRAFR